MLYHKLYNLLYQPPTEMFAFYLLFQFENKLNARRICSNNIYYEMKSLPGVGHQVDLQYLI